MSKTPNLRTIRSQVSLLARLIGASDGDLPTFGPKGQDRPRVEVTDGALHYVFVERGEERSRYSTRDVDELLYNVFRDVTASIASRYELAHRVRDKDNRRLRFYKQEELLTVLSPTWAKRMKAEHEKILHKYPYDDTLDEITHS